MGFLRRKLSQLTSTDAQVQAAQLLDHARECGAVPIAAAPDRAPVTVSGTLRAVTLRPRAGVPALEAELYDGSGSVSIVWLGRRRIPGIDCGRAVKASGLITADEGRRVMFNPRYELRSAAA